MRAFLVIGMDYGTSLAEMRERSVDEYIESRVLDLYFDDSATEACVEDINCALPPNAPDDVVEPYLVRVSYLSERELACRYVGLCRRLRSLKERFSKACDSADPLATAWRRATVRSPHLLEKPLYRADTWGFMREIDLLTEQLRRVHNLWSVFSSAWFISTCDALHLADWLRKLRKAIELLAAIRRSHNATGNVRGLRFQRAQRRTKRRAFLESQFGENRVVLIRNRDRFERCGGLRVVLDNTSGRCRLLGKGGAGFRGGQRDESPWLRGARAA